MRVVYIHQYFRTPNMAGGTRSYEFARRLVSRGHKVMVVTADPIPGSARPGRWRTSVEDGIEVHWVSVPYDNSMPPWRRLIAFIHFVFKASLRAACLPQDVVFATSTPLTVAIPGAWSAFRNRVPMVFEVRDLWPAVPIALGALRSWPLRAMARLLERCAYRWSHSIIALSPDMADGVRDVRPSASVHVIPNACDLELFGRASDVDDALRTKYPWIDDRPIVLYAGTFGRVNGVGYLVDIAIHLQVLLPEAAVVLVGSGAEFSDTRNRALRAGVLDRNCFVLSQVPKEEVAAWFRACAIATSTVIDVPELTANSANKFFDALAAGRPVAINHGGWLAKELEESGAGLILPPVDTCEAARMLAEFLSDRERMARARDAAMKLARSSFDRNALARQVESVLVEASDGRATGQ